MVIPKTSKEVGIIRNFLTLQRSQVCSTAESFSGPLKELFKETVDKIDAWINQLPKEDVPGDGWLESQLDYVFSLMAQLSAQASLAGLELNKLKNGDQFASSLTLEIQKQVAAGTLFTKDGVTAHVKSLTDAGDLVVKDRVVQLCAEAKNVAFVEGENKVRGELEQEKKITELVVKRRASLQAAGLPVPEASLERVILGGTDEEFEKRKTAVETRREALKKDSIQLASDSLQAQLWLEEAAYAGFEKTVRECSKSAPQFKINPLLGTPGGNNATPAVVLF